MERLDNIHPGEILKEEFLDPMGITSYRLSKETGMSETRIGQIVHGKRSVTAETALILSLFFGTTAGFWLNLQNHYDLEQLKLEKPELPRMIHKYQLAKPTRKVVTAKKVIKSSKNVSRSRQVKNS